MRVTKPRVGAALAAVALIAVGMFGVLRAQSSAQAEGEPPQSVFEQQVAQRSGLSLATVQQLEAAALGVAADKAEAQGLLSSAQAKNLRAVSPGQVIDPLLSGVATAAHTSETNLIDDLLAGKSLAQITDANGGDIAAVRLALTDGLQAQLAGLSGVIDPAKAALLTALVTANLDAIVNTSIPHDLHGTAN